MVVKYFLVVTIIGIICAFVSVSIALNKGGNPFPARFASEARGTSFYTGQEVTLRKTNGLIVANIKLSSMYGSSKDGKAEKYQFKNFEFMLNGVQPMKAKTLEKPIADQRSNATDGSYSDQSAWKYHFQLTFPGYAASLATPTAMIIKGCTADNVCDYLELPVCKQGSLNEIYFGYSDYGTNKCGPSWRAREIYKPHYKRQK